jgi:hypothetical protein
MLDMAAVQAVVDSNPDIAQIKCACAVSKSLWQHVRCGIVQLYHGRDEQIKVMFKGPSRTHGDDGTILGPV